MMTREYQEYRRLSELIPLWLKPPEAMRTEHRVADFYNWLERNRPELLRRTNGDPYQCLVADLRAHICTARLRRTIVQ